MGSINPTTITRSTDVLIVGAGPAGLMAGVTLARYGAIDFLMIDQEPTRKVAGHSSAFQPRTQEILQTMDLLHDLDKRGHRHTNTAFWEDGADGHLARKSRSREVVHPTPYPYVFNTDQGITEEVLGAEMVKRGHCILRPFALVGVEYSEDLDAQFPVLAHILNVKAQTIETWEAKYILGADGARSVTRKAIGAATVSNSLEHVWAVADVFVKTDFPDHRCRAVIRSEKGGCMLIPRKDNGVRIFTQINEGDVESLNEDSHSTTTADISTKLIHSMQSHVTRILHPYTMIITGVLWQSHYSVKQRLLSKFRDARGRVFVLGDACHTHSPKAGQGLNISMQDAYNLTWKLALVLKGRAREELLATYESERRHIAQQLIDFDVQFAGAFAGVDRADAAVMQALWEQNHGFTSGLQHAYTESMIVNPVASKDRSHGLMDLDRLATEPLTPGKRLLPAVGLTRLVDGNTVDMLNEMPSNGRFHVFVFADLVVGAAREASLMLVDVLASVNRGVNGPFEPEDITHAAVTERNAKYVVDLFVVHRFDFNPECNDVPMLKAKMLSHGFPGRMYEEPRSYLDNLGVGSRGALVLVRPDGYIALVTTLDVQGVGALDEGLRKVLIVD